MERFSTRTQGPVPGHLLLLGHLLAPSHPLILLFFPIQRINGFHICNIATNYIRESTNGAIPSQSSENKQESIGQWNAILQGAPNWTVVRPFFSSTFETFAIPNVYGLESPLRNSRIRKAHKKLDPCLKMICGWTGSEGFAILTFLLFTTSRLMGFLTFLLFPTSGLMGFLALPA